MLDMLDIEVKKDVLERVIASVKDQIKTGEEARAAIAEELGEHASATEGRYDMRDIYPDEARVIYDTYGCRLEDLRKTLHDLELLRNRISAPVKHCSCGALVKVEDMSSRIREEYIFLPVGGKTVVEIGNRRIIVVSLGAPIEQALRDAFVGKEINIPSPGARKRVAVVAVA